MKKHQDTSFLKCIHNNRGFTLVEVLIALLVLGILLVPVNNAFLQSVKMNQHLQQRVRAVREAQAAMEVTLSLINDAGLHDDLEENAFNSVEIALLHQDSPFYVITSRETGTKSATETTGPFTLTVLRLPGKAPWLTPKEYRVVTP